MLIPTLLQIAIDKEWGVFFHDQFKITFPPHAVIEMDYQPPDINSIWVTFALTFGNIVEESILIEHSCAAGMKRHLDPSWYSIGIGPSFEYPLWIYCSQTNPHVLKMTNLTAEWVDADAVIWMVEMTPQKFKLFQNFVDSIVDSFSSIKPLYETLRNMLIISLYPEVREEVRYKLFGEIKKELMQRDITLRIKETKP